MFKHSTGYVFDARVDCNSVKGIKESFKLFNGVANITCGIDAKGRITRLKTYTADGFTPVRELGVSMDAYLRSNRATYAVLGDCTYIASVRYNLKNGDCQVLVYIPIQDINIETRNGKKSPGVCAYLISPQKGLHRYPVSEKIYQVLTESIKAQIEGMDFRSKASYYMSRM